MEAFFSESNPSKTGSSTRLRAYEGGHHLQVLVRMTQLRYVANPAKRSSLDPRKHFGNLVQHKREARFA
jgi:hypothetical protein